MPEQNTYTSNYTPPSFEGGWEESALIIFVRNPVLGKVKTRLATTLGDENTLAVYKYLLQHTKNITQNLSVTKFVFY